MNTQPVKKTKACPKINLYLHIREKRDDGYHTLNTLFYPLKNPCDILSFYEAEKGRGFSLSCSDASLAGEDNIVYTAYNQFCKVTRSAPDIRVHLEKNIPHGAGLGGGSSDAACLLQYVNTIIPAPLSESELRELGAEIGADVPFFLQDKPCIGKGIGDELTPVDVDLTEWSMLLITPEIQVSTAKAYDAWDSLATNDPRTNVRQMCFSASYNGSSLYLVNDFEKVVFPMYPELLTIKQSMLSQGASGCVMSGSGSSIVAFFCEHDKIGDAQQWLNSHQIPFFTH